MSRSAFLCVPIKIEGRTAGALSVDKPFRQRRATGERRQSFLNIVAAFLAQAIQINRMVMRQKEELLEENAQLRAQVRDRYRFENIIGDSPAMHEVFATVGQVANSRATVLLLGETGTGKEMIAKAIHYNSPRRDKPFIRVNCGALTGTLLESELFGHVKGSFTGAIRDKEGPLRGRRRRNDFPRRNRHHGTAPAGETSPRPCRSANSSASATRRP
jgi:Nif-specific regulatory protein